MKKLLLVFAVGLVTSTCFSASLRLAGDDICTTYFPSIVGKELVYESYSAKDKLEGSDILTVKDVRDTTGGIVIDAHSVSKDKKGEILFDSDYSLTCIDGMFRMSFESIMDPSMMGAYKDMDVEMTQTEMIFPSTLTVGQSLPDATMTMNVISNGTQIMSIKMNITNRKVEAKESITTPAGTFEAYKFSETQNMKMMFIDKTFNSVNWIVAEVGSVRSETYSDNGKLENYRVLTSIK